MPCSQILGTIGSEFGKSNSIAWLGTSYLLTQTAFQPLYGRFSDIFGRKAATLFASAVFLLGSLACGLSKTFPQLIAARAFAGIGGGGLTTMSSIVTSDLVSLRQRGTYQGLGNVVYAAGAAIGGPLGGYLGDGIGWRWAFLIQVSITVGTQYRSLADDGACRCRSPSAFSTSPSLHGRSTSPAAQAA